MRALITGASGQLGQSLLMQEHNLHELIAFSRAQLEITNADQLNAIIEESKPDVVINLAAYTAVDQAEANIDSAFAVNAGAVKNIAKITNHHQIPVIHLSTDYVFSGDKESPYVEADIPNPINVYGKSKLAGEIAIREHNPQHIIVRSSWVFSAIGKNFLKTILRFTQEKKEISVVADQIGGPTCADDLASFLIVLLNQLNKFSDTDWGVYHYCGTPYVSWFEFAQEIINQLDSKSVDLPIARVIPISSRQYAGATRPANSRLNMEKAQVRFGVAPSDWRYKLKQLIALEPFNIP